MFKNQTPPEKITRKRERPRDSLINGFNLVFDSQTERSSFASIAPETDVGDWIKARQELKDFEYETFEKYKQGLNAEQIARNRRVLNKTANAYLSKLERKGFIESYKPAPQNRERIEESGFSGLDIAADPEDVEEYLEEEQTVGMNELRGYLSELIKKKPGDPKKLAGITRNAGKDADMIRNHDAVDYNVTEDIIVYEK